MSSTFKKFNTTNPINQKRNKVERSGKLFASLLCFTKSEILVNRVDGILFFKDVESTL
jgi:hypothetical protein